MLKTDNIFGFIDFYQEFVHLAWNWDNPAQIPTYIFYIFLKKKCPPLLSCYAEFNGNICSTRFHFYDYGPL